MRIRSFRWKVNVRGAGNKSLDSFPPAYTVASRTVRTADCAYKLLCLVWASEAFCEASMKPRSTDARRDAIVVGRQLGVVLLEHVQPLGSPLYGIVSAAELVVPLSALEGARACVGLVAHLVEPLGESYVALVVLQVPVVALLKELGRGVVPAASWHIVVRVRHLDSTQRLTDFGSRRRFARLRYPIPPLLSVFRRGLV